MLNYPETGRIINTHALKGELKVEPWANSPEELLLYNRFFIRGIEYKTEYARVSQKFIILKLLGVNTIDDAEKLKGETLTVSRDDLYLKDGEFLIADLEHMTALDYATGVTLGSVAEILTPPGGEVLVINGEREILVPVNGGFIKNVDLIENTVTVELIEGM